MDIITILLLVISIILLLTVIVLKIEYLKLSEEYFEYRQERYRNSNKLVMAEYYIREYKEKNGNPYTLARELTDLLYHEGIE